MPRKDDVNKKKHTNNDRARMTAAARENAGTNDYAEALTNSVRQIPLVNNWFNEIDAIFNSSSYSDFVSKANQGSDGWYSAIANGLPFVKDLHNALLGRDSAKDYLSNNNLTWKDMQGYNDMSLLGRASAGTSGLINSGGTYLNNIGNDLGKLYSGQKTKQAVNLYG